MLKRSFLGAMLASIGLASFASVPRQLTVTGGAPLPTYSPTRSRLAGRARKSGAKLGKKLEKGTITLRNTSKGGYGETVRSDMNLKNAGFYSRT